MKVLLAFGKYQYGDSSRGVGIEYEAFIPALERIGHETKHFETWDRNLYPTYAELNRALLNEVISYQPDIVFTVQRDYEIWTETLESIQQVSHAALVTWTTDDSFKFPLVSKYIGHYYDAISTTYAYRLRDYRQAGIQGAYSTQWAANSHWLVPPKDGQDCRYPVSFIGASYGSRSEIIEKLQRAGIHVECFGFGWPNGSVTTNKIPLIMRDSVISLNFSSGFTGDAGKDMQIKARTFEVPGAGGFLLTDTAPGLETVYRLGSEIETYDGFTQLVEKINHYLFHLEARDEVALAGYRRTLADHTYEKRLEGLLHFAVERREERFRREGSRPLNSEDFAGSVLPEFPPGFVLLRLRALLVAICTLVWGADRGPKAARRLVFGLSRTLLGATTFSAKSLPGRLFPYV